MSLQPARQLIWNVRRLNMESRLNRYRKCAATCAATTYGSGASVRRHNAAATKMRQIVAETGAAEELLPLLDEPESGQWLAYQLLELCEPAPQVRDKCLAIIRRLATGSGADALGAQYWLRDFKG
jgi:hypothetical protein